MAERAPGSGPSDVSRDHIRGWTVHTTDTASTATARGRFAGLRHFFRWAVEEAEVTEDPTQGIKTPGPTNARSLGRGARALVAACKGNSFVGRRDRWIIMLFLDGGLRLPELAGLA